MNTKIASLAITSNLLLCVVSLADDTADRIASLNQLRQIGALSLSFANANNGRFPKAFDEFLAFQKTVDRSLFISPYAADKTKPSYEILLPGERLSRIDNPARAVFIRSLFRTVDGSALASFADGHVELIKKTQ